MAALKLWKESAFTIRTLMQHIQIQQGNIVSAQVDAIVNAANPQMLGGGGVDGAIHAAAGPKLLAACREVPAVNGERCPFGEARITAAGDLPCRYVIHTVGPVYHQESDPDATLQSSYKNSLNLAQQYDCQSIAFPAISCGVYGFPPDRAAQIALQVCSQQVYQALDIRFYLFSESMVQTWRTAFDRISE